MTGNLELFIISGIEKRMEPQDILEFWFGKNITKDPLQNANDWFTKNADYDAEIAEQFKPTLEKINAGGHADWNLNAQGSLAYILVTDQFPRNIFRNQKTSFSFDPIALTAAIHGIQKGYDQELSWIERCFYYLPFEHAEDLKMQELSLLYFQNLQRAIPKMYLDHGDEVYDYAIKHWEIIKRFGRFPHRNAILKRTSTPEEIEFLKQPGSAF